MNIFPDERVASAILPDNRASTKKPNRRSRHKANILRRRRGLIGNSPMINDTLLVTILHHLSPMRRVTDQG